MPANLWTANTPQKFWQISPDPAESIWNRAIQNSIHILGFPNEIKNIDQVLEYALGEARYGKNHFKVGMVGSVYYLLKPFIPKSIILHLRKEYYRAFKKRLATKWPIEPRYVEFQWEILRQVLLLSEKKEITFRYFWPRGKRYAFILTHDIEAAEGQRLVPVLADMEEALGFRSMFNFVPEKYNVDFGLVGELRKRGFEIGVHGLKHDGTLFNSSDQFLMNSKRINQHLQKFQAHGFRAPLTIRNPEWMQLLDIEYDLSFFDTDPYEPIPGGSMSIWPFTIGRFMELPYTLPQDSTLYNIMKETSPRVWLEKINFIEKHHGMALGIVHPDYSGEGKGKEIYRSFLNRMKERTGYWHALPQEVVSWWQKRNGNDMDVNGNPPIMARAVLVENNSSIQISIASEDDFTAS